MRETNFTKMVASGNDFVVIENKLRAAGSRLQALARKACDRKYGIGADGLLVLEKSRVADRKMRVFNADGSEAEMCGNGARCIALWITRSRKAETKYPSIETKSGIIESEVNSDTVKIKLTNPSDLKLDIGLKVNNRPLKVNFVNTGVPHAVVFVEGLGGIDIVNIGRQIRYHHKFTPAGTNVDFVEILDAGSIRVRTYERGVEDETLACGTGAVAASLISELRMQESVRTRNCKMSVLTKSGEVLRVYFDKSDGKFRNIWLEGKVRIVCKGAYYV